jgi:serine/threonine protein kinase
MLSKDNNYSCKEARNMGSEYQKLSALKIAEISTNLLKQRISKESDHIFKSEVQYTQQADNICEIIEGSIKRRTELRDKKLYLRVAGYAIALFLSLIIIGIPIYRQLRKIDQTFTDENNQLKVLLNENIDRKSELDKINNIMQKLKSGDEIGSGNSGTVRVHDENKRWVVKESKSQLTDEFNIGKDLEHPILTKSHDLFIDNDSNKNYMVMDRVKGEKPSYYIFSNGLGKKESIKALSQLRDCALYLYDKKVYWKDTNGNNFFIDSEGNIKLIDYGHWNKCEDSTKRMRSLLLGSFEMVYWVEYALSKKDKKVRDIDSENRAKSTVYPSQVFGEFKLQFACHQSLFWEKEGEKWLEWIKNVERELGVISNDEKREFLAHYFDEVIEQVKINYPDK